MKKIFVLTLVLALALAGTAFATGAGTATAGQTIYGSTASSASASDTAIGKLSNNVTAGWYTAATGYAVGTFHTSGSQAYGSAHDSTSIYMKKVSALPAFTATGTGDFTSGSWTAL